MKSLHLFLTIIFVLSMTVAFSACNEGDGGADGDTADGDSNTEDGDNTTDGDTNTADGDNTTDGDTNTADGDNDTDGDSSEADESNLIWQNPPAGSLMDWEDAKDYCINLSLDGYSDWRLPTISELRSLIRGCPYTETDGICRVTDECLSADPPCLDTDYNRCEYESGPADGCYWSEDMQGKCGNHWSSSQVVELGWGRWSVSFPEALVRPADKAELQYVRCVSNGVTPGTWLDPNTKIIWENPPLASTMMWKPANRYCDDLRLDNHSDWRLPTIDELRTLTRGCNPTITGGECPITNDCTPDECTNDHDTCYGSCNSHEGPDSGCYWDNNLEGTCYFYWSSTIDHSFNNPTFEAQFFINFENGGIGSYSDVVGDTLRPRCMRKKD